MSDMGALGNFKGVMLCNRPAQIPGSLQSMVGTSSSSGPSRPAFISTVANPTATGLPPIRHERRPREKTSKSHDITYKHKKWLSEFAERRCVLNEIRELDARRDEVKKKRFTEKSKAMRDVIRSIRCSNDDEQDVEQGVVDAINLVNSSSHLASASSAAANNNNYSSSSAAAAMTSDQHVRFTNVASSTSSTTLNQQLSSVDNDEWNRNARAQAIREVQGEHYDPSADQTAQYKEAAEEKENAEHHQQVVTNTTTTTTTTSNSNNAGVSSQVQLKKKKLNSKPGWARTEEEDDELFDLEADELVNFAQGLDYEAYIDDLEVKEALQFVASRIQHIEHEHERDAALKAEMERMLQRGELEEVMVVDRSKGLDENGQPHMRKIIRRVKKERVSISHADGWNASTQTADEQDVDAQAEALTKTVLDSNRAIRQVHSSASVRAVMEQTKKSATTLGSISEVADTTQLQQLQPPVISTIVERESKQQREKDGVDPSNLPYLYRHPGI